MKQPNAIQEIMRFQSDRELDKQAYCYWNESVNFVEEIIEGNAKEVPPKNRETLKNYWEEFVEELLEDEVIKCNPTAQLNINHESVDYLADLIVFAIGGLMKQGYDPEKVLLQTAKEINSRTGKMVNGKFEKFTDEASKAKWYKADFTKCRLE